MTKLVVLLLAIAACDSHTDGEFAPGPQGEQGEKGDKGDPGPAGPQGPPGQVTVLDGGVVQGPQGPKGDQGPIGPIGPPGMNGTNGTNGSPGSPGAPGAAGATGPAGPTGAQGVPGSQGPGGGVFGEAAAQFAGFTTTPIAGAGTGREAMNARCGTAFTGAHLCHFSEYYLATSATAIPSGGAWIDSSGWISQANSSTDEVNYAGDVRLGRIVGASSLNCASWNGGAGQLGYMLTLTGASQVQCTSTHVLACCSTPYAEKFRGFTTATVSGGRPGGRPEMHQLCGAQFAGSHLCHAAEYARASPTVTPPAAGVWIDSSTHLRSQGDGYEVQGVATGEMGRYTGSNSVNCTGWSDGTTQLGYTLNALGIAQVQCSTAHALACCGD